MSNKLPTKLVKEPLVDAIFEIRFDGGVSAADVLPGYLFTNLEGKKSFERLPASDLPQAVRKSEPNLHYAPLIKIHWDGYTISIGDKCLVVGCKMPYPGWKDFKKKILLVLDHVKNSGVIEKASRYSLKYIDLIESKNIEEQVGFIDANISIGAYRLESDCFRIRLEMPRDNLMQILIIASSATVRNKDGLVSKEGLVVDVDTIKKIHDEESNTWFEVIFNNIEEVKKNNKEMFFNCLTDRTIEDLGAVYE